MKFKTLMIATPNFTLESIVSETTSGDARFLAGLNRMLGEAGIPPRNSLEEIATMPTDPESLAALKAGQAAPVTENGQGTAAATRTAEVTGSTQAPQRVMCAVMTKNMTHFSQEQYSVALARMQK